MSEACNEPKAVQAPPVEAGDRRVRHAALAAEVKRLAEDPTDTAERRELMADMDAVSAGWPG